MGDMPRYFQEALFEGGAESARQVGEQQVQPAGQLGRSHSADQRARHGHRHAQRRRGARAIRGALHAGRETLGRADDRHWSGKCSIYQPFEKEGP